MYLFCGGLIPFHGVKSVLRGGKRSLDRVDNGNDFNGFGPGWVGQ